MKFIAVEPAELKRIKGIRYCCCKCRKMLRKGRIDVIRDNKHYCFDCAEQNGYAKVVNDG